MTTIPPVDVTVQVMPRLKVKGLMISEIIFWFMILLTFLDLSQSL
jgi:hypothetical protein